MKTKLLCFLLLSYFGTFAQINVSESFETSFPTGWSTSAPTSIFTRGVSSLACQGDYSMSTYISSSNSWAMLVTPNYTSNGNPITVSFQYNAYNFNSNAGFIYMYYDVNNSDSWQLINTGTDLLMGCKTRQGSVTVPENTSVRFRMQVNRSGSNDYNISFDNFSAVQDAVIPGSPVIAEYNFNNSYANILGTNPFTSTTGTSFATDRHGNANSALNLNGGTIVTSAIINDLPVFNESRTISLWINPNQVKPDNIIFTYGIPAGSSVYGASFNANNIYNYTYSSNLAYSTSVTTNTWKHIVYTYNQATGIAKIFVNGILASSGLYTTWNTGNNDTFYLGNSFGSISASNAFNGVIDDLKIYNYALNDTEISNLYNYNSLSTEGFTLENSIIKLYPNPVKDILNIETALEIQSVEIYTIQGQKVVSSTEKKINVSHLASGIYLVKTQDSNNKVSTSKIVIK